MAQFDKLVLVMSLVLLTGLPFRVNAEAISIKGKLIEYTDDYAVIDNSGEKPLKVPRKSVTKRKVRAGEQVEAKVSFADLKKLNPKSMEKVLKTKPKKK